MFSSSLFLTGFQKNCIAVRLYSLHDFNYLKFVLIILMVFRNISYVLKKMYSEGIGCTELALQNSMRSVLWILLLKVFTSIIIFSSLIVFWFWLILVTDSCILKSSTRIVDLSFYFSNFVHIFSIYFQALLLDVFQCEFLIN